MNQDSKKPVLTADRPRSDPAEDLLGYRAFAKLLATSVLHGSPASGIVVGIYGEWGLGKTTVLNFIEHFVHEDVDSDPPIVIRFNPWWFSGREDLMRRFFKEFESAVKVRKKSAKRLMAALNAFGEALTFIPSVWASTLGKAATLAARDSGKSEDLVELKRAIEAALSAEMLRVIVLVDDIDRLLPSEMTEVFRLVRAVGDFPNVHYVLAFDHEVVAAALTSECKTDGARYLEKIIQAPFNLPPPSTARLHSLFARRLDDVLADSPKELFDQQYWSDVFTNGIALFLKTPRDVLRLINSLAVM